MTMVVNSAELGVIKLLLCSRDYIIACCDEAARRREALRGKIPRHFVVGSYCC